MAIRRDEFTFGDSPAMRRVLDDYTDFAASPYPILLTGETGTGKTWLARYIHELSGRSGPFISSAVPQVEELAQGQLFGYEKGAFTGATESRSGYLELASDGTLFLDEVGTASPRLQAMLLTVVEACEVWRIGARRPVPVDTRLVFATNELGGCDSGLPAFRLDLWYRIGMLSVGLPRLRDRADDIPELARSLLRRIARRHRRECPSLTARALVKLQAAPWPGSLRQLDAVLIRAFLRLRGRASIDAEHLDLTGRGVRPVTPAELSASEIRNALALNRGNLAATARQFDKNEKTFRRRVKALLGPRSEWHLELAGPGHDRNVSGSTGAGHGVDDLCAAS
ncbi:MAG TPA: sigma 54-interacting transcriptional regulator [Gemmatimonadales bacterium]|nr:sigma 54-interacting transcriptional regulator [Gemmatimonadales bacterium]